MNRLKSARVAGRDTNVAIEVAKTKLNWPTLQTWQTALDIRADGLVQRGDTEREQIKTRQKYE